MTEHVVVLRVVVSDDSLRAFAAARGLRTATVRAVRDWMTGLIEASLEDLEPATSAEGSE